ncbi:HDOD domain-containing protein [Shewanella sp. VB17]|uniref:HDOD domain-containing protein n=1 Tax=Shewanella sp. VB17 TaxID=2739432 RepID=UPI0015648B09|nr:HDOD domain-containing protein [Shewanella sp. VB17]NRD71900.1 HDOD domain-containing protein [Shewanella sp. VB17]
MVSKIIKMIFNVRDDISVERPKSFSTDFNDQKIESIQQKSTSNTGSNQSEILATAPINVSALFYGMLFPSEGTDDGGIANNLEKNVITEVEQALTNPNEIAETVLKLPSQMAVFDQKLSDETLNSHILLAMFQAEPVLSAEVLQLCNSSVFKHFEKEVTSLQHAFVQLGRVELRRLVSTCFMKEMIDIKPIYYRRFGAQIWRHSMQVAYISRELSKEDPDTAFMLGLLHDVGKIAIFKMLVSAFHCAEPEEQPKSYLFKQLMTTKSLSLSALLVQCWELPSIFESSLNQLANIDHKPMDGYACVVWRANVISECSMLFQQNKLDEACLTRLLADAELSREEFNVLHDKLIII